MTPLSKLPRNGVEAAIGILPAALQLLQVREQRRHRESERRVGRGRHDRGLRQGAQKHRRLQTESVEGIESVVSDGERKINKLYKHIKP